MDINDLRGVTTVLLLIAFIGICFWAWSKHQRKPFDEAANQLFDEEEEQMHQRTLEEAANE